MRTQVSVTRGTRFYAGSPTVKDSVGEWKQAAAEGITVIVSTGDSGSTGCDSDQTDGGAGFGLAVNGVASTPYNVAVGGTDFNDATNPTTFFNASNPSATTQASVKGYIPETTYNDTCTNSTIETLLGLGGDIEADCNQILANGGQLPLLPRPRAAAAELAPARLRTVKPPARAQAVTPNLHFRRRSPSTTESAICRISQSSPATAQFRISTPTAKRTLTQTLMATLTVPRAVLRPRSRTFRV